MQCRICCFFCFFSEPIPFRTMKSNFPTCFLSFFFFFFGVCDCCWLQVFSSFFDKHTCSSLSLFHLNLFMIFYSETFDHFLCLFICILIFSRLNTNWNVENELIYSFYSKENSQNSLHFSIFENKNWILVRGYTIRNEIILIQHPLLLSHTNSMKNNVDLCSESFLSIY